MVMSDLYSSFQRELDSHNRMVRIMRNDIMLHKNKAAELRDEADLEDRRAENVRKKLDSMPRVAWPEKLVHPLAEELSRRSTKKNFTVIGPVD